MSRLALPLALCAVACGGHREALDEGEASLIFDGERVRLEGIERHRNEVDLVVWTGDVSPADPRCSHPHGQPAILGSNSSDGDTVLFEPRFPFVEGQIYTACAYLGQQTRLLARTTFSRGEVPGTPPRAVRISPSGVIPANTLRLYVHFSSAMQTRDVAKALRLRDQAGTPIELPFVEIASGLWDTSRTRLTVFFHPGRVKRGVGTRAGMGAVLAAGHRYRLHLGAPLRDLAGRELEAVTFDFETTEADYAQPRFEAWQLHLPASPGDPLTVRFDERLDEAQVQRWLRVATLGTSTALDGEVSVGRDGRTWTFRPQGDWQSGPYELLVNSALEDLAGNSLARRFDVPTESLDAADLVVEPGAPQILRRRFEIP